MEYFISEKKGISRKKNSMNDKKRNEKWWLFYKYKMNENINNIDIKDVSLYNNDT